MSVYVGVGVLVVEMTVMVATAMTMVSLLLINQVLPLCRKHALFPNNSLIVREFERTLRWVKCCNKNCERFFVNQDEGSLKDRCPEPVCVGAKGREARTLSAQQKRAQSVVQEGKWCCGMARYCVV